MSNQSHKGKSYLYRLATVTACVLAGIICAKSFVLNPELYCGKSTVPAATTDYIWTFLALVLAWLFHHAYFRKGLRPRAGEVVFGLLFGFLNYFATALFAYDSWAYINATLSLANVLFKCLGQAFTMMAALSLASSYLASDALCGGQCGKPTRFGGLVCFYREHTTLSSALLFLLCWSPYLLAFYPGTVIWDMSEMVSQFFGLSTMTTWHSVFTTWVFSGLVWFGRLLGSDNIGVCLYMLLQTGLLAWALGASISWLRRLGVRECWQMAVLAFFALVPIWGCYAQMIGKDTLFTATLLLFTLQTLSLARKRGKKPASARDLILYGVTALLCCLWRNNGLYVVLPTALGVVLFLTRGRERLRAGAPLAAAVLLTLLFDNALVPALGIVDTTSSGIYSVCFQQTARTVRDHYDELTQEEKDEIDRVLDLEGIRWLYEPWISDPVKNTFRQFGQGADVEKEALARYRKTWAAMLPKYPVSYIQAFIGGNSGYYAFTPAYIGITYNQQAGMRFVFTTYGLEGEGQLSVSTIPALEPLRNLLKGVAERWRTLPVLALLYVCPVYTWLLVAAAVALAHKRRWRDLVGFLPALMSFAVCLLSPANDYFRYFLPIIAMTPALLAFVSCPSDAAPNSVAEEQKNAA